MESLMSPQVFTFSMYLGFGTMVLATLFMLTFHPPVWGALTAYGVATAVTALFGYILRDVR